METKYIIYTINLQGKVMYVGKCRNFTLRKWQHLNCRGIKNYSAIPTDVDLSLITINKIGELTDNLEALKEEDRLIVEYDTINNGWNKLRSGHIRIDNNTEYQRIHGQLFRAKDRVTYNAKMREYRKRKKETA